LEVHSVTIFRVRWRQHDVTTQNTTTRLQLGTLDDESWEGVKKKKRVRLIGTFPVTNTHASYLKVRIFFCWSKWVINWNNVILQAGIYILKKIFN